MKKTRTPVVIIKGMPIPEPRKSADGGCVPRWPWLEMKVGDCFNTGLTLDRIPHITVLGRNYTIRAGKKNWRFVRRVVNGTVHVWRVK